MNVNDINEGEATLQRSSVKPGSKPLPTGGVTGNAAGALLEGASASPLCEPGSPRQTDSLTWLTGRLRLFRRARGWERHHTPAQLAASVAIEAGELPECFQWGAQPTTGEAADEIADVAIYLLNLADVLGLDLGAMIWAKIARNAERFPVPA